MTPKPLTRAQLASDIVDAIGEDFTDRRGLRQAWDGIDEEIRTEIVAEWRRLVEEAA